MLGLVLLILLVPFRYSVKGRYRDPKEPKLLAAGKASWLFGGVKIEGRFKESTLQLRLRLFGITIKRIAKSFEKNDDNPPNAFTVTHFEGKDPDPVLYISKPAALPLPEEFPAPGAHETAAPSKTEGLPRAEKAESGPKESRESSAAASGPAAVSEQPEPAPRENGRAAEQAPNEAAEPEKTEEEEKKKGLSYYWKKYTDFRDNPKNRETLRIIKKQLIRMAKHLLPTHFCLKGELGTGEPAVTGEIIGAVCSLMPVYGEAIRLEGIYDRKQIDLTAELAGRIRVGVFAEIALRLIINKNFRHWIKWLRKRDKGTADAAA